MTLPLASAGSRPRVLHADYEEMIISSVARLLYRHATMLTPVTSLSELVDRLRTDRDFDILLLDLVFGPASALPYIRRFLRQFPGLKIVVLTGLDGLSVIKQCIEAGAAGVVAKPFARIELPDAIATVHAGEMFVSPSIGTLADVTNPELASVGEETLRVLHLLRKGLIEKEIADLLCISVKGVQYHKAVLVRALRLQSVKGQRDWRLV